MDFNNSSGIYGLAQAAGLVKDGAVLIVKEYVNDDVSITFWVFNTTTTKLDIDLGNPIILLCHSVYWFRWLSVVVAYGYAKYNDIDIYETILCKDLYCFFINYKLKNVYLNI